ALMQYLIEQGHEHIIFLSHHEMELLPVMERYRAYQDAMRQAGLIPAAPWIIGQPGNEIGSSYMLRTSLNGKRVEFQQLKNYMLNAQPRPTAIFAINDYVAIIAMRAMKLLNLAVPDAVSIAGFDDTELAAHLEVPMTTVAQDS